MIIVAVLGVIGILLIMNLQLCSDSLYSARYYGRIEHRESSYYIARSAFDGAKKVITFGGRKGNIDSLHSIWAQSLPEIELDEGTINVRIEDENRYFNINTIERDDKHLKQFQRLLEILERPPDFANAALDWIDSDKNATTPGGSETMRDTDQPCKNGPFDSIEELFYINGFKDSWYPGEVSSGEYKPGLKDVLTSLPIPKSSGGGGGAPGATGGGAGGSRISDNPEDKINVNTASMTVLQSLDPALTRESAQEIIKKRDDKAIESMDELLTVPGFTSDILYKAKYLATTMSSHFRIIIEVKKADDRTLLTAVVKRESGGFKTIYWKVE
jgi:general secretion pathway protein K